jgi:hypothetical protein
MINTPGTIPKIVIKSIAGGLLLMAFFTTMWSGIASGSLNGLSRYIVLGVFSCFSLAFIVYGIYLFSIAKNFAVITTDEDRAKGKNMGKWFGIIFGLEGVLIPIAAGICIGLHHSELVLPAIALVVGLHFYPMAKIFNRTIDYYLATWTTLIALIAIVMLLKDEAFPIPIYTFLGVGVAMATTSYGLYMMVTGNSMVKTTRSQQG